MKCADLSFGLSTVCRKALEIGDDRCVFCVIITFLMCSHEKLHHQMVEDKIEENTMEVENCQSFLFQ